MIMYGITWERTMRFINNCEQKREYDEVGNNAHDKKI